MDFINEQIGEIDSETVESTFKQIHYFVNLPKHIKGSVSEFKDIKPNDVSETNPLPAHVIDGTTTVIQGKLNIPVLNYPKKFLNYLSN